VDHQPSTLTSSNLHTLKPSHPQTLKPSDQPFKPSNLLALKPSDQPFKLSNLQALKPSDHSNSQNSQAFKLSNSQTLKLSNLQAVKPSDRPFKPSKASKLSPPYQTPYKPYHCCTTAYHMQTIPHHSILQARHSFPNTNYHSTLHTRPHTNHATPGCAFDITHQDSPSNSLPFVFLFLLITQATAVEAEEAAATTMMPKVHMLHYFSRVFACEVLGLC
jgi:hypothetical protein